MASISGQTLTIIPLPGGSVATVVNYQINWEPADAGQLFSVGAAMRGADPLMDDDLAPLNAFPALLVGPGGIAPPTPGFAINVVPRSALNEDADLNLIVAAVTNRDEVYARVTLNSVFTGTSVSADTSVQTGEFGP